VTSPKITGSCITGNGVTRKDLSNLPANIQISRQNSNFPAKKIEFIATIQIDQWERFAKCMLLIYDSFFFLYVFICIIGCFGKYNVIHHTGFIL
jgi:hypothetical protein